MAALTDQTPVTVSDLQGIPAAVTANGAGTWRGWTASRRCYAAPARAGGPRDQLGDEAAASGSRVLNVFVPLLMNSAGRSAVRADVLHHQPDHETDLTLDGTTLQVVGTGQDIAPGTGGKKYERAMSIVDLNANGDVLRAHPAADRLDRRGRTNDLLKPAGGAIVRIAGPGTAPPGTGGR